MADKRKAVEPEQPADRSAVATRLFSPGRRSREPFTGPGPASAAGLAGLQRQAGNRTVLALLGAQAKLEVGRVDDPLETEADAMAQRVVEELRANAGRPAGAAAPVGTDETDPVMRRVQRTAVVGAEGGQLDSETEARVDAARGGGTPLPTESRRSMEAAFGTDFGSVRLHADRESSQLNRQMGAQAFTIGSDIFFAGALPDTSSDRGRELLAHELTHTVQQGAVR